MSRANNPPAAPAARSIQIVGLVALVVGIIGLYPLLTQGGRSFNQGSALAWGLPVVTYAFLALASFGVAMVAMLGIVVRQPVLDQLARRHLLLAFSLSIGAIIALALELGHPFRALWAIPLNIQLRSPLLWMGVCWGIYLLSLIAGLLVLRQDGRRSLPRGLSILILVSALAGLFTQGLVYGMMSMRPVWFGFATPLYFLVGSLPLGLALISLFGRLTDGSSEPPSLARGYFELQILPRLLLAALVLYFITWLGRLITGLWTVQDGHQVVYAHMVESPLFYVELLLGRRDSQRAVHHRWPVHRPLRVRHRRATGAAVQGHLVARPDHVRTFHHRMDGDPDRRCAGRHPVRLRPHLAVRRS
jgi:molybdopterin-containing oxidoreductase family membrane subunit